MNESEEIAVEPEQKEPENMEEPFSVHVVIRDVGFYEEDSETEIWNLAEIAMKVFTQFDIKVLEEEPGNDTVDMVVEYENLEHLRSEYEWEIMDQLIYVYLKGTICGADAHRVEISYVLPHPPLRIVG